MYTKIVHPTDLSEASVPALKVAHELATTLRIELTICYIAHPPMIADGTQLTDPESGSSRDIQAEISDIQPPEPGVNREVRVITIDESSDVKPLLGVLESMGSDLLVIGMHQRKGIKSWWSKSIAEEVVRHAHCDVLVVKEQAGG